MNKIALTFSELTPDQADALVAAYAQITSGAPIAVGTGNVTVNTGQTAPAPRPADVARTAAELAPAAPAAPGTHTAAPGTDAAGELDAFGVPWNGEVHASTKRKTKEGRWARVKFGDKAKAEAWEKAHQRPAGVPASAAPAGVPAVAPGHQAAPDLPPPPPVGAVPLVMPAAYPLVTYDAFRSLYMQLYTAGKLDGPTFGEMLRKTNAPTMQDYVTDEHKRAHAFALLSQLEQGNIAALAA